MIFWPYILRALKLRQIWVLGERSVLMLNSQITEDLIQIKTPRCVQRKELLTVLAVILTPIFILCLICLDRNINILHVVNISQCVPNQTDYYDAINNTLGQFVWFQMLHNVLFFIMLFIIRDVDDKFSIGSELRKVCFVSTACTTIYTFSLLFMDGTTFVIMGWQDYLLAIMSLSLLYFTAWTPIRETYKQSQIIPFSLNLECLANVESAMI